MIILVKTMRHGFLCIWIISISSILRARQTSNMASSFCCNKKLQSHHLIRLDRRDFETPRRPRGNCSQLNVNRQQYSILDLPRLASTYVGVAVPTTRRIAELDKRGRLDLDGEVPGVAADPVHRLVDAVPAPLETRPLRPLLGDILAHRDPDVEEVGAGVHPGGGRVGRHCGVCDVEALDARGRVEVQRSDAPGGLALVVWTGVVPAIEISRLRNFLPLWEKTPPGGLSLTMGEGGCRIVPG